jgi:hypothetical protein
MLYYNILNYEGVNIMNLSSDTVSVLKNFSDINQNILVKPGKQSTDNLYNEKYFGRS